MIQRSPLHYLAQGKCCIHLCATYTLHESNENPIEMDLLLRDMIVPRPTTFTPTSAISLTILVCITTDSDIHLRVLEGDCNSAPFNTCKKEKINTKFEFHITYTFYKSVFMLVFAII